MAGAALPPGAAFRNFTAAPQLSATEVFVGEDVYLFEEISNAKRLPLPYLKVEDDLPDGLAFVLYDLAEKTGRRTTRQVQHLQSLFTLPGGSEISRRWRVRCLTRGIYRLDSLLLLSSDVLGLATISRRVDATAEGSEPATLVVLPSAIDLNGQLCCFALSFGGRGAQSLPHFRSAPHLRRAGIYHHRPHESHQLETNRRPRHADGE